MTEARETPTQEFSALPRRRRRRLVLGVAARSVAYAAGLVTAYYLLPFDAFDEQNALVGMVIGTVILVAAIVTQLRGIQNAEFPVLRAIVGLALAVPLLVLMFAATFLAMSANDAGAFNEQLDHTGALYLSMTTSTTVGFGDISARTDAARIVVMLQMVANVAVLGVGVRLMLTAARYRSGFEKA